MFSRIDDYCKKRRLCPPCKICIGEHIWGKKKHEFFQDYFCKRCTGYYGLCRNCLKTLYKSNWRRKCDLVEYSLVPILSSYMISFGVRAELTSCWRMVYLFCCWFHVPYCNNLYHNVVNTFTYQDVLRKKVVHEGFLLKVNNINSPSCSEDCTFVYSSFFDYQRRYFHGVDRKTVEFCFRVDHGKYRLLNLNGKEERKRVREKVDRMNKKLVKIYKKLDKERKEEEEDRKHFLKVMGLR